LGLTPDFSPPSGQTSAIMLSVRPTGCIALQSGQLTSAVRLLLETWTDVIEPDRAWTLSEAKLNHAIVCGRKIADFVSFLEDHVTQPLPEEIAERIRQAESDATALRRKGPAELYQCRDAETAAAIMSHRDVTSTCLRAGEAMIIVPASAVPKFQKLIEKLRLGIV
jgi:hypothetical protein